MIRPASCLLAALALASLPLNSRGDVVVYSDNFDSGTSMGTASQYYSNNTLKNGLVVTQENLFNTGGISQDVSGNGYFLFNGTDGGTTPAGQNYFYISSLFTVTANTTYTLSFYLANDNPANVAQVMPFILGVAFANTPVSAVGSYQTNGFQQFTYTFTSTTSTTERLSLENLQTNGGGNDFAIDNILISTPSATAVPEPSSLALCGLAGVIGSAYGWRRRRARRVA